MRDVFGHGGSRLLDRTMGLGTDHSVRGFPVGIGGYPSGAVMTPLWTPAELPGAVWVDADTVTLNGSTVAAAVDKIGGIITASQASAGDQPALVSAALNGLPVMQFDGGDWLSFGTALGRPTDWTIFSVAMLTSATSATVIGSSPSSGDTALCWGNIEASNGRGMYRFGDGSAYRYGFTSDVVFTANSWFCECDTFSAGGPTPLKYVNGTAKAVGTDGGTATTCGGTAYGMSIGRLGDYSGAYMPAGSRFLGAVIAPSAINTATRQKLEGYYMHRAGLTSLLPSDHPYKSAPPTI